jgi:hypothetical protein
MQIEYRPNQTGNIAVVTGEEKVITDVQSALDLVMTARYEGDAEKIAIDKHVVAEDFFILSTGLAGEILQKFTNYRVKAAFYGDFTRYTSKPLRDFIYESNQGHSVFFVSTQEEAVQRLAECAL